jgi:hypothetical protein
MLNFSQSDFELFLKDDTSIIEHFSASSFNDIFPQPPLASPPRLPASLVPWCGPMLDREVVSLEKKCISTLCDLVRVFRSVLLSDPALSYLQDQQHSSIISAVTHLAIELSLGQEMSFLEHSRLPFYLFESARLFSCDSTIKTPSQEIIFTNAARLERLLNEARENEEAIIETPDFQFVFSWRYMADMARVYGISIRDSVLLEAYRNWVNFEGEVVWYKGLEDISDEEEEEREGTSMQWLTDIERKIGAVNLLHRSQRRWGDSLRRKFADNLVVGLAVKGDVDLLVAVNMAWEDSNWVETELINKEIGEERLKNDLKFTYDIEIMSSSSTSSVKWSKLVAGEVSNHFNMADRIVAYRDAVVLGRDPLVAVIAKCLQQSSKVQSVVPLLGTPMLEIKEATREELNMRLNHVDDFIREAAMEKLGKRNLDNGEQTPKIWTGKAPLLYLHEFEHLGTVMGQVCNATIATAATTTSASADPSSISKGSAQLLLSHQWALKLTVTEREPWAEAFVKKFGDLSEERLVCLLHGGKVVGDESAIARLRCATGIKGYDVDRNEGEPGEKIMYVRREAVVADTRIEVKRLITEDPEMNDAKDWTIVFMEDDYGYHVEEWFQLCSKKLFAEEFGLFKKNERGELELREFLHGELEDEVVQEHLNVLRFLLKVGQAQGMEIEVQLEEKLKEQVISV